MTELDAAGLSGKLPPMSVAGTQKMQLLELTNTSITQYSACSTSSTYLPADPNECLPDWLTADPSKVTVPLNAAGMLCPALRFNRSSTPELRYIKVRLTALLMTKIQCECQGRIFCHAASSKIQEVQRILAAACTHLGFSASSAMLIDQDWEELLSVQRCILKQGQPSL